MLHTLSAFFEVIHWQFQNFTIFEARKTFQKQVVKLPGFAIINAWQHLKFFSESRRHYKNTYLEICEVLDEVLEISLFSSVEISYETYTHEYLKLHYELVDYLKEKCGVVLEMAYKDT